MAKTLRDQLLPTVLLPPAIYDRLEQRARSEGKHATTLASEILNLHLPFLEAVDGTRRVRW